LRFDALSQLGLISFNHDSRDAAQRQRAGVNMTDIEDALFEADIALALARVQAMDWNWLAKEDGQDSLEHRQDMHRKRIILAYAMFQYLVPKVCDDKDPRSWHAFLEEALAEVLMRASHVAG
jgi:hypothetical protein